MVLSARQMLEEARANVPEISAPEAKALLDRGGIDLVLDVREPAEWDAGHIPGALHVPRGLLEFQADSASPSANPQLTAAREARVVVHCAAGARSLLAAETLKKMGYSNVSSMAGGFAEWATRGFPVE